VELVLKLEAILLVSLRVGPTIAFAPLFTLMRVPATIRVLLALAIATALVGGQPEAALAALRDGRSPVLLMAGGLFVGVAVALCLPVALAAVLWAGGAGGAPAGLGPAPVPRPPPPPPPSMPSPASTGPTPSGVPVNSRPYDLLALWAASLDALPVGSAATGDMDALAALVGGSFAMAVGLFGIVMLVLFLLDLAIAFMSRTLPQMNMLLLGFQVKSIAMLAALPIALALSTGVALGLLRFALAQAPRLLVLSPG